MLKQNNYKTSYLLISLKMTLRCQKLPSLSFFSFKVESSRVKLDKEELKAANYNEDQQFC